MAIKKTNIAAYSLLYLTLLAVAFNSGTILQNLRIWYASGFVRFSTNFESGSFDNAKLILADKVTLDDKTSIWRLAYEIIPRTDPSNPTDSTLTPNNRWFYFRMIGVKDKQIHLLFKLTDPIRPVYSYDNVHFERFSENESTYRKVSKRFEEDTVFIAYYIPYDFSYLQQRIKQWCTDGNIVQMDTIGWSSHGKPLQLMTITDHTVPDSQKGRIYIQGRIHPSETPASWHMDGIVDAILANTSQAKEYRRLMVFYILPIANPDGVSFGLSRSNLQGIDLESNYNTADSLTSIEVRAIIKTLEKLCVKRPLDMVLNMHSQTTPHLTYWIHTASSTSQGFFNKQMLLANLTMARTPFFDKNDLLFSDLPDNCLEGWIWERYGERTLALTFETPYTYYNNLPYGTWVTLENLKMLGTSTLYAIGDYFKFTTLEKLVPDSIPVGFAKLKKAYPDHIKAFKDGHVVLNNNTRLLFNDGRIKSHKELLENADIDDMFTFKYPKGIIAPRIKKNYDPGRFRNEDFFKSMYGHNKTEVIYNLVEIIWCPKLANQKIRVTIVNGVSEALLKVSEELDEHPEWEKYLKSPGTFNWRAISGTGRLSAHCFGIAIDLNVNYSEYWKWDNPNADENTDIIYRNQIPQGIVDIFEKNGFIWGGKWYHYDTMHFEYRPELL